MSLKSKLIYIVVGLVLLFLVIFGYAFEYQVKNIMLNDKTESINLVLSQNVDNALEFINQFIAITELTSRYPPIQGIIRSQKDGVDPVDGSSLQDWKKRIQSIFSSQLETLELVYQIRYIDASGNEIVRVQKYSDRIDVISEKNLQNKADRYYFQEAKNLKKGEVYISPTDLNVEEGKIQRPFLPTIRFCTRIESETDGSFQGVIVLNFAAEKLFDLLDAPIFGESFIINQDGYYLTHQDVSKIYGFQLGVDKNYFLEQPELKENLRNADQKIFFDTAENEYRIWKKVYYRAGSLNEYWIVVHKFKKDLFLEIFYSWRRVLHIMILIGIFLIGCVAWIFANSIIDPIVSMSSFASKVEKDQLVFNISSKLTNRNDEVGQLARAVEKMGEAMLEGNVRLEQTVKEKTKELQRRMKELEEFNSVMIGREKRMVELKQMVNKLSEELGHEPPFDVSSAGG